MAEGHGEIEVDVKMLHDKLSAETGEDGKHVIVIKKEVSSSSSDDDH